MTSTATFFHFTLGLLLLTLSVLQAQQQQQQRPVFQSITEGGSRGWLQDINNMPEAERQRRIKHYQMPKTPPNRWLQSRQAPPQRRPQAPAQVQQQPRPTYAPPRPQVVLPESPPRKVVKPRVVKTQERPPRKAAKSKPEVKEGSKDSYANGGQPSGNGHRKAGHLLQANATSSH